MSTRRDDELALLGEPLVSPASVAKFLGISRTGIYRLAGAPDGIPCVEVGGAIRFRPSEVRAYVERQTVKRASDSRVDLLLGKAR